MTRFSRTHLVAGLVLLLTGAAGAAVLMTADTNLTERDRSRLDRAKETHTGDIDRAEAVYRNAVERANTALDRVYADAIRRYDQRGDTATADALRAELAAAMRSAAAPGEEESVPAANPAGHTALLQSIGNSIIYANGHVAPSAPLGERRYVLLYFSAGWCGPCRAFTPQLASFHQQHAQSKSFEVVFVSSDRSLSDMGDYMRSASMNWPAIPFEQVGTSRLQQTYEVRGIPRLVVLGQDGKVVLPGTGGANATLQEFSRLVGAN